MGVWLCIKLRVENSFLNFTDTATIGLGSNMASKYNYAKLGLISCKYTEFGVLVELVLRWRSTKYETNSFLSLCSV